MIDVNLMQKLAVSSTGVLYYDYSNSECFYVSGGIPLGSSNAFQQNAFQNTAFQESTTPVGSGIFLVSPMYAQFWIGFTQASVIYNPFRAAVASPGFRGFSNVPAFPVQQ